MAERHRDKDSWVLIARFQEILIKELSSASC
jgi:hypothetical protein